MPDPRILVSGETLVDFLPDRTGLLDTVESFSRRAGGAPANLAVGLARLDRPPWFWTRVGEDPFGDFLAGTLSENGIPERFVERDPTARTTLAFVTHDRNDDRSFTFYRDGTADTRIEAGTVPDDTLAGVEWVAIGGVALSTEPARTATLDLIERANTEECGVLFDPNARPELWNGFDMGNTVETILPLVDVVKASMEDLSAAGYDAESPSEIAETVCSAGPHTTFLTLGEAGALAHTTGAGPWPESSVTHDGFEVEVVDTTGAGDGFAAGVLAGLLDDGRSLSEVLGFATAVGALTTTASGAMAALPDRDAVEALRKPAG